ncbi:MAG: VOC family protein [Deltaproteobacteria bacterium]|nr:VOC family protein [Deltaproteobacteria bacterium]
MITGLDHVHVMCGEVEEAVRYFKNVFDGKEVSRGQLRGFPLIRMDVQGVFINLMGTDPQAGQLEPGKGSRGLDHFGFRVKDLESMVADLKKKGAKFSVEPSVTPTGVKFAFVDGPEGIRIELLQRD